MIRLRFNSLAGTDPATLGPAPFFRVAGPLLQQGPEQTLIARYFDHHWEIGSRYVSSYECVEAVLLHFEGPAGATSKVHGPFQQVRFPNGSCYADRTLFAELVEHHSAPQGPDAAPGNDGGHGRWMHLHDLTRWPVLVISPVAPGLKPR